jgi:hypothetical protein
MLRALDITFGTHSTGEGPDRSGRPDDGRADAFKQAREQADELARKVDAARQELPPLADLAGDQAAVPFCEQMLYQWCSPPVRYMRNGTFLSAALWAAGSFGLFLWLYWIQTATTPMLYQLGLWLVLCLSVLGWIGLVYEQIADVLTLFKARLEYLAKP